MTPEQLLPFLLAAILCFVSRGIGRALRSGMPCETKLTEADARHWVDSIDESKYQALSIEGQKVEGGCVSAPKIVAPN